MNTVAKYLRISSEDVMKPENRDSASIVNQRHLLDHYLDTHPEFDGWNRVELCDDGWSGTSFERPAMKELLDMVRRGDVQCIIVKDLSRFGRNYLAVGDYISRVFPFMGVRFISLGDGYDSARPEDLDSLSVSFSTIIYDLYSKELSDKVKNAKDRLAAQGQFLAPAAPYGYVKDKENKNHLVIDPEAAETVRDIFDMVCDGYSTTEIARKLNQDGSLTPMRYKRNTGCKWLPWPCISEDNFWTAGNVMKIVRDERYTGCIIYGKRRRDIVGSTHTVKASRDKWIVAEDTHEAIISRVRFNEAQGKLRAFRESGAKPISSPLARRVYCGCCGRAMAKCKAKNPYYVCKTPVFTDAYPCPQEPIPEDDILKTVVTTILVYAKLAVDVEKLMLQKREKERRDEKKMRRRRMAAQSKKEQTELRLQDMYETFFEGGMEKADYVSMKQTLSNQLTQLVDEINALDAALSQQQENVTSTVISTYKRFDELDELAKENFRDLLERVTIYPGGVMDVRLRFRDELEAIAECVQIRACILTGGKPVCEGLASQQ